MRAWKIVVLGTLVGLSAAYTDRRIHYTDYVLPPTPQEVAARAASAAEEEASRQVAKDKAAADFQHLIDLQKWEISKRLPEGCHFEDYGSYHTLDPEGRPNLPGYPIFAIFCPDQKVTLNTFFESTTTEGAGKMAHIVHHPHSYIVTTVPENRAG